MALSSQHDILLTLADDLPIGVWVARAPDGELIYANRAFVELVGAEPPERCLIGYSERLGLCTREGARYPETRLPFARALAEHAPVVIDDLTVRRRDGKQVELRALARPVGDPISHVVIALFDVGREVALERSRIDTEALMRRAQRFEAIGTLASGIAHDFNNLIFGIKLIAADLAVSETDAKRRQSLELIDELSERSSKLTRSLISFTRRGEHRATTIGVSDVVTAMSELLTRTLAGVELSFELAAADRGAVVGDQSQLEQVVMNLVLHARDAVQNSGRVVVRTADWPPDGEPSAARFVALEVKDDGAGVLAERAPSDDSGQAPDLAAVFGIVDRHGGSVEVDGGLDGRGTTMRVLLPAVRRPVAGKPRAAVAELPRGSGLVLVIDDDHMVRKVVASSLVSLGYDVIEAVSGSEAVEIYRARHGDIRAVVLDLVMPGMSAQATYLALRDIERGVAVLLMSGHSHNEQVQEVLDLGVRSFVSKPYSIAALAAAMVELTGEHQASS